MQWSSRLVEYIIDWRALVQRNGWRATSPKIFRQLAGLPYRRLRMLVLARSLTESLPDIQAIPGLILRTFLPADIALAQQINLPSEAQNCARRLARKQIGWMALCNEQPVGYAWACAEIVPQLEHVPLDLREGDALAADAFVAPAWRNRGIHSALALARCRFFRERGYCRILTCIDERNAASLKVWQSKFNSTVIGKIDFMRLGAWRWTRYSHCIEYPSAQSLTTPNWLAL